MEKWARQNPNVQFLCVCVESARVAQMFHRMFNFQNAMNAYIPGRHYMPVGYGQLGCSGFIVSDANGNFVSRKTSAYLRYGEEAFRQVEDMLEVLVPEESSAVAKTENEVQEPAQADETDAYPTSTGITSMDHEHDTCAEALKTLLEKRTESSLREVMGELQNHFAHEEALMVQHGFGGDPADTFSALTSHVKDHKRILAIADTEHGRLQASSVCNAKSA